MFVTLPTPHQAEDDIDHRQGKIKLRENNEDTYVKSCEDSNTHIDFGIIYGFQLAIECVFE